MNTLQERLRSLAATLRRTPLPISAIVPELQLAADRIDALEVENAALEAENAALKEDAERYRWLTDDHPKQETRVEVHQIALRFNVSGKGRIDAAIDAARSKT